MHKELHVSHMSQPPKPVTIPLTIKKKNKKKKKKKTRTTHAHFLGYNMDWKDRNVTDIYSFEPNTPE